jgi:hypothetical protein
MTAVATAAASYALTAHTGTTNTAVRMHTQVNVQPFEAVDHCIAQQSCIVLHKCLYIYIVSQRLVHTYLALLPREPLRAVAA